MKKEKERRLEQAGWTVGTAEEFLGISCREHQDLELKAYIPACREGYRPCVEMGVAGAKGRVKFWLDDGRADDDSCLDGWTPKKLRAAYATVLLERDWLARIARQFHKMPKHEEVDEGDGAVFKLASFCGHTALRRLQQKRTPLT